MLQLQHLQFWHLACAVRSISFNLLMTKISVLSSILSFRKLEVIQALISTIQLSFFANGLILINLICRAKSDIVVCHRHSAYRWKRWPCFQAITPMGAEYLFQFRRSRTKLWGKTKFKNFWSRYCSVDNKTLLATSEIWPHQGQSLILEAKSIFQPWQ